MAIVVPKQGRRSEKVLRTEQAQALCQYRQEASRAYRNAIRRRDGSSGPASEVRHIPVEEEAK
jgi:hypothetical protein